MRGSLLGIALMCAGMFSAQEVRIDTRLDTLDIRIGEQTTYRITASGVNDPSLLQWPQLKDTLHRSIEIVESLPIDTLSHEETYTLEKALIITSWDSGYYAIRPLPITYDDELFYTEAMLLSVNTVQVDTTAAPLDIKPIYHEPFSFKDWLSLNWPYLLIAAILLLIVLVILRLKRKGTVDVFGPRPVPAIPIHEQALARLKELRESQAPETYKKKTYYSELTDTLRAYLEGRYGVPALEQTSKEIMQDIRYKGLSSED
ncbi:MAG: hypothetical protein HKN79_00905, partial [Flavobacteriales bacterium]|nr:hypothetical protein [Flavobacteriales bacterium]